MLHYFEYVTYLAHEGWISMECNKLDIGQRIKELREMSCLTQADIAKALSVKRETVNQWENGTRDLKTDYSIKLANYFNTTCDYILRGVKSKNVDVNRTLGLTDKAIYLLECANVGRSLHVEDIELQNLINTINFLLENINSGYDIDILGLLSRYFSFDINSNEYDDEFTILNKNTGLGRTFKTELLANHFLVEVQKKLPGIREEYKKREGKNSGEHYKENK